MAEKKPKSVGIVKDDRLYIRLKSSEYELIQRAAEKAGLTISQYVRNPAIRSATAELADELKKEAGKEDGSKDG